MHNEDTNPTEMNTEHNREQESQELRTCKHELESWKDKYLRAIADFNNFKRRTEKEQALWIESAQTDMLRNLLPIVDDFDRALAELGTSPNNAELQARLAGFQMINNALYKLLKQSSVEPMSNYTLFDPTHHEAIASVSVPGKQAGEIVEVLQKGFMFKDRVLRPARVAVAQ